MVLRHLDILLHFIVKPVTDLKEIYETVCGIYGKLIYGFM
jgi:hypothetical protein